MTHNSVNLLVMHVYMSYWKIGCGRVACRQQRSHEHLQSTLMTSDHRYKLQVFLHIDLIHPVGVLNHLVSKPYLLKESDHDIEFQLFHRNTRRRRHRRKKFHNCSLLA